MKNKIDMDWIRAAGIRALKTVAQTAMGMFTIGAAISDVDWKHVVSVSIVAGIYSILTNLATGLPETKVDGDLLIDTDHDPYGLTIDIPMESLTDRKTLHLSIIQHDDTKEVDYVENTKI